MILLPQTGHPSKIKIRVISHNGRSALTGLRFKSRRNDHATGLTEGELALVFGVAKETDLMMPGRLQGCQASNHPRGITAQTPAKPINQRSERQRHRDEPVRGGYLAAEALSALITFSVMSCLGLM